MNQSDKDLLISSTAKLAAMGEAHLQMLSIALECLGYIAVAGIDCNAKHEAAETLNKIMAMMKEMKK